MEQEGVIKFELDFTERDLDMDKACLAELNRARGEMIKLGLMGQDDDRYEGYGFGNISLRADANSDIEAIKNESAFWISGTQTGSLTQLDAQDISLVTESVPQRNKLVAYGRTPPSSESMTHAVLYQLNPAIEAIIHVHSPDIWHARTKLALLSTSDRIEYGTPEMAQAVVQLAKNVSYSEWPILFCMDGHEDGVVVAGESLKQCSEALTQVLQRASSTM